MAKLDKKDILQGGRRATELMLAGGLMVLARWFGLIPEDATSGERDAVLLGLVALLGILFHVGKRLATHYGWLSVLVFVLAGVMSNDALATPVRIGLVSGSTIAQPDVTADEIEATKDETGDITININDGADKSWLIEDTLYLDLSAGIDVFVINLNTREYNLGAVPGVGYGLKYAPGWWTLSPVFLAVDVVAQAGVVEATDDFDGPDYFTAQLLCNVILGDWISVGLGPAINVSLHEGLSDSVDPVLSVGIRKSL